MPRPPDYYAPNVRPDWRKIGIALVLYLVPFGVGWMIEKGWM
jgi:hypothetical protein